MIPLKRRKSLYLKMGTSRRAFLTRLGRSKGFLIKETYSSSITHVVSENNSGDEVQAWLDNQTGRDASSSVYLLDTRWFSESVEAGHPVIVQDRHILKEILEDGSSREVESTRQSEQYQAMKALTGIFGVGVRTADRWFREGLQSPDDLIRIGQPLNHAQQAGTAFHCSSKIDMDNLELIQLMGGFRRSVC
uniref:Polymerase (DNA directed), mu n=1 Tax=Sinocyclocheilus rhinocerous TaxID=307959 RepID=A0A673KRW7_9TELE